MIKVNCFKIHHRNLQKLAVEILKVKINIAPEVEAVKNPSSLRNQSKFKSCKVGTVRYGIGTVSFVRMWNSIPFEVKKSSRLDKFKDKIRYWIPENCPANSVKLKFRIGYGV